jgi:hypothetical protein
MFVRMASRSTLSQLMGVTLTQETWTIKQYNGCFVFVYQKKGESCTPCTWGRHMVIEKWGHSCWPTYHLLKIHRNYFKFFPSLHPSYTMIPMFVFLHSKHLSLYHSFVIHSTILPWPWHAIPVIPFMPAFSFPWFERGLLLVHCNCRVGGTLHLRMNPREALPCSRGGFPKRHFNFFITRSQLLHLQGLKTYGTLFNDTIVKCQELCNFWCVTVYTKSVPILWFYYDLF